MAGNQSVKGSNFKDAVYDNTIFDSANLDGVNFKDDKFSDTIFWATDIAMDVSF